MPFFWSNKSGSCPVSRDEETVFFNTTGFLVGTTTFSRLKPPSQLPCPPCVLHFLVSAVLRASSSEDVIHDMAARLVSGCIFGGDVDTGKDEIARGIATEISSIYHVQFSLSPPIERLRVLRLLKI